MKVTRTSDISGHQNSMDLDINDEQLEAYYTHGELLQNAFPNLNAGEREFIKTGITPAEWDSLFGTGE